MRIVCLLVLGLCFAAEALPAQALLPEMRYVPAGAFLMGTGEGAEWEGPVHRVQLGGFWISSRPVSIGAFQRYRPNHENPTESAPGEPVLAVSWDDANSYCRWLSAQTGVTFRLASEAEWERAARGGLVQQRHPWGEEKALEERKNPFGLYFWPNAPWEWVADWFAESYFAESPERDPQGPDAGKFRVLRGGGYPDQPEIPAVANRGSARPAMRSDRISFRMVSDSEPPAPAAPARVTSAAPAPKPAAPAAPKPVQPAQSGGGTLGAVSFTRNAAAVVKLEMDAPATCKGFPLRAPDRYVVDCPGVTAAPASGSQPVTDSLVKQVRWSQFQVDPKVARAVIDLTGPATAVIVPVSGGVEVRLTQ